MNETARLKWAREFFNNMVKAMVKAGYFPAVDDEEVGYCLEFFEDLHGKGPAIFKKAGEFEMLGVDVCINLDKAIYIQVEEPSFDFFVEPENSELLRFYSSH